MFKPLNLNKFRSLTLAISHREKGQKAFLGQPPIAISPQGGEGTERIPKIWRDKRGVSVLTNFVCRSRISYLRGDETRLFFLQCQLMLT
jgi:hypothetical protein